MRLLLTVVVPQSADPERMLEALQAEVEFRQGITIMTPKRFALDVDLVAVEVVDVLPRGERNDG